MATRNRSQRFDPDIDRPSRPAVPVRDEVGIFQRVVLNPGLAILGGIFLLALHRFPLSMARGYPLLTVGLLVLLSPLAYFLLQYHCLDCGATGWIAGLPDHACDGVVGRKRAGLVRSGVPGAGLQVRLWLGLMYLGMVAYLILFRRSG